MLEHGGNLVEAARRYHIPLAEWLDLSTGINPEAWPVPTVPPQHWHRLPQVDAMNELELAAASYYGAENLLATAGSQAAIKALPHLRSQSRVGLLHPSYNEHAHAWRQQGHTVIQLDSNEIGQRLEELDVLVIVNPNNPTGEKFAPAHLLDWHMQLADKGGWLIVDEAFMDSTPAHSLVTATERSGLIVLRSLGKFFGLAGARCGFVFCNTGLRDQLQEYLGPWTVAGPTRWIASLALQDSVWQQKTRNKLQEASDRLRTMLSQYRLVPSGGTSLFQWVITNEAEIIQQHLARHGIWVRHFSTPNSLRFGLPGSAVDWQRFEDALANYQTMLNTQTANV